MNSTFVFMHASFAFSGWIIHQSPSFHVNRFTHWTSSERVDNPDTTEPVPPPAALRSTPVLCPPASSASTVPSTSCLWAGAKVLADLISLSVTLYSQTFVRRLLNSATATDIYLLPPPPASSSGSDSWLWSRLITDEHIHPVVAVQCDSFFQSLQWNATTWHIF